MHYGHFKPFRTHRLPRDVSFGELVNAYGYVSNKMIVPNRTTRGERSRDYDPFQPSTEYTQPSLHVVFKNPNMSIPVRAVPVRKKDLPKGDGWPEAYRAIRFCQPPAKQRFRGYRKAADKFAEDAIRLIDEWLTSSID